jgi:hypothetical protein
VSLEEYTTEHLRISKLTFLSCEGLPVGSPSRICDTFSLLGSLSLTVCFSRCPQASCAHGQLFCDAAQGDCRFLQIRIHFSPASAGHIDASVTDAAAERCGLAAKLAFSQYSHLDYSEVQIPALGGIGAPPFKNKSRFRAKHRKAAGGKTKMRRALQAPGTNNTLAPAHKGVMSQSLISRTTRRRRQGIRFLVVFNCEIKERSSRSTFMPICNS